MAVILTFACPSCYIKQVNNHLGPFTIFVHLLTYLIYCLQEQICGPPLGRGKAETLKIVRRSDTSMAELREGNECR